MSGRWTVSAAAPVDERATSHQVSMHDGIRLATDVYLPQQLKLGQMPTVLVRLPYDKSGRYTFMPALAARLVERGFAAVVQDVRGKFRSEGDPVPFVNEAADGARTLDWIASQAWSDGVVGMMGDSYYGFTQWAAVSTGHPALRAIVPRFTGSEFFEMFAPDKPPKDPFLRVGGGDVLRRRAGRLTGSCQQSKRQLVECARPAAGRATRQGPRAAGCRVGDGTTCVSQRHTSAGSTAPGAPHGWMVGQPPTIPDR